VCTISRWKFRILATWKLILRGENRRSLLYRHMLSQFQQRQLLPFGMVNDRDNAVLRLFAGAFCTLHSLLLFYLLAVSRKSISNVVARVTADRKPQINSSNLSPVTRAEEMGLEFGRLPIRIRRILYYSLSPEEQRAWPKSFRQEIPNMLERMIFTLPTVLPGARFKCRSFASCAHHRVRVHTHGIVVMQIDVFPLH